MFVRIVLWLVLVGFSTTTFAQKDTVNTGVFKGVITDHTTKKPIDFANVQLELYGKVIALTQSDLDGEFSFDSLRRGSYTIKVKCLGYHDLIINVEVTAGTITSRQIVMEANSTTLQEVTIKSSKSLVTKSGVAGSVRSSREIGRLRNVPDIRGSRSDGTAYYIDGVRVQGGSGNERYKKIEENSYISTRENPLSTFSIDVDKASYTNVRRYISSNYLPPADAVRVEEMINYFTYDVEVNKGVHPFGVKTEVADAPWDAEKKLVYVSLKAPEIDMTEAPQSHLTFLIDVSGSMESDDKLPLLKDCLRMLVEKLRDDDRISIVVYAGAAGLILESERGKNKGDIFDALRRLQAGGSTAGGEGIELAYNIAARHFIAKGNNRIILATDGDFNVGLSNVSELQKLIEKKRESGIYLSVLGFGTGNINDELMETLADKGNGNYNYIDGLLEGKKVLVNEMGGTLFTVAKDVKIQVEFNPKYVSAYKLIGYENRMLAAEDFNNDKKDAGELGAGHCVTAIYEVITGKAAGSKLDTLKYQQALLTDVGQSTEIMNVKVRYKMPADTVSVRFEQPVLYENKPLNMASNEMRFAVSVALFGMKLRGSEHIGKIGYDDIIKMGKAAKGKDDEGYRAEFIKLVKTAELLAKRN